MYREGRQYWKFLRNIHVKLTTAKERIIKRRETRHKDGNLIVIHSDETVSADQLQRRRMQSEEWVGREARKRNVQI